jgi:hypothetical protein
MDPGYLKPRESDLQNMEITRMKTINQANLLINERTSSQDSYRNGGVKQFGMEKSYLMPRLHAMYHNNNMLASTENQTKTKQLSGSHNFNDRRTLRSENGELTMITDHRENVEGETVFDISGIGKTAIFNYVKINKRTAFPLIDIMKMCSEFDFRADGDKIYFHCPTARSMLNLELVTVQSIILLHIISCVKQ